MIRVPTGDATPASIVDALKAMAGTSPKARASFARGRCVRGTYIPSDRAEEITKSRSFTAASRVLARFSLDGGNPRIPDTDSLVLRGFSFRLGDIDHRSDILTQSAPVHYARTPAQMLAYLKARLPGPTDGPIRRNSGVLHRQSRDAASGNLHGRPSASRKLCRHHLLGRPRFSRNKSD